MLLSLHYAATVRACPGDMVVKTPMAAAICSMLLLPTLPKPVGTAIGGNCEGEMQGKLVEVRSTEPSLTLTSQAGLGLQGWQLEEEHFYL